MTNEEAREMLIAKLKCLRRETSGTDTECNNRNCVECPLNYEQGNMGEQKEALETAIKALEQQPILDKIKTEIAKMNEGVSKMLMPFDGLDKVTYTTGFIDGLGSTLDIINKYRAESEDAE